MNAPVSIGAFSYAYPCISGAARVRTHTSSRGFGGAIGTKDVLAALRRPRLHCLYRFVTALTPTSYRRTSAREGSIRFPRV
jgi:hypothetical protein